MRYLIDTNVVSEARKRERANPGVRDWLQSTLVDDTAISVITVGEIEKGILRLTDPARQATLNGWLHAELLPAYVGRTLDVTQGVMREWARLVSAAQTRGYTPGAMDALIAATATHHGLIIVTRNTADFTPLGVPTLNPFT